MKKKAILLLLCLSLVIPVSVYADTKYETSEPGVEEKYEGINMDTDNETLVKVAQASTFKVSIPKTVSLNGKINETNKGTYEVAVEGNIASNEVIIVKPLVKSFLMKDLSLAKADIVATIEQPVINFVGIENKDKNYSSDETVIGMTGDVVGTQAKTIEGTITVADLSAGKWEGNFNFHIKLDTVIETASTEEATPTAIPSTTPSTTPEPTSTPTLDPTVP